MPMPTWFGETRRAFEQQSRALDAQQPQPTPATDPTAPVQDQNVYRNLQQQSAQREQAYQGQLQAERQRASQMEEYIWQQQLSQVDPSQRPYAQAARDYQLYLNQVGAQYNQMQGYTQQLEQAVLPMVKDRVFTHLSQHNGIPKEILQHAETPADAEKIIRAVADLRKRQNLQVRKDAGLDNVPQSSGQANATTQDTEMTKKFRNSGKLADYIRAKQAAGQW